MGEFRFVDVNVVVPPLPHVQVRVGDLPRVPDEMVLDKSWWRAPHVGYLRETDTDTTLVESETSVFWFVCFYFPRLEKWW